MVSLKQKTLPLPVVEWKALAQSSEPLKEASRSRYRTLLKHGIASRGVTTAVRGDTRLAGRRTFHSVLAALAVRAEQAGDTTGAAYLSKEATLLEERYADGLSEFLLNETPDNLPNAEFYWRLLRDTSRALDGWTSVARLVFASGRLTSSDAESAHIEGTTMSGNPVELLLPRFLTDEQGLSQGDAVWVFRRLVGHAAVVDVIPAIAVDETDLVETPKAELFQDRGYEAEAEAAKRYADGPGALPTRTDLARLIQASEDLPVQLIKLVG